jgi:hypothetical protein
MSEAPRWVIVVVVALLVIGFLAFARGRDHQRGDETGSGSVASAPLVAGP